MAGFPRQALHAETLALDHVRTGTRMRFRAPLPDDMIGLIDDLRKHAVNCESLRPKGLPDLGLTRLGV
jgi:23S rRNA pseudouridine1911/1915/1917 synthase